MDIAKLRKKSKDRDTTLPQQPQPVPAAEAEPEKGPEVERCVEGEDLSKPEPAEEETVELLTFSLASEEYAFRIGDIREIIRPQRITRIPKTEPYLLGITSLRGKVIPVVDLKGRLSLAGQGGQEKKRKILILNGPKGPIGALIDRVFGVVRPRLSEIGETPPHLLDAELRFIEGVVLVNGRFISIVKTSEALNV